ncbi:MAG: AraC family ligand binding domain-containing protein [Ktedonobacterales bacterium]
MVHQTSQSSVANWQERETLWYFGGLRIIQALETQTKPTGIIFEYLVPARTSVYLYGPHQEDTAFYVLAGEVTFFSGETTIQATPGTFLFLPRPVGFRYVVPSSSHVRLLTWTTPLGFAQQVTRMGNPGEAFVLSPPPIGESEKLQQLATVLRAYLGRG